MCVTDWLPIATASTEHFCFCFALGSLARDIPHMVAVCCVEGGAAGMFDQLAGVQRRIYRAEKK